MDLKYAVLEKSKWYENCDVFFYAIQAKNKYILKCLRECPPNVETHYVQP